MSTAVNANCNFVTGNFIKELSNPKSITKIEVEVPKSAKFNRNFAKIIISPSDNIPPQFKKKFRATLTVRYTFGSCSFEAQVRQHGDWKDHIGFINTGEPLRSLSVRLKEGNILNAVKFRLLIPETRGNLNEVLGALLMRKIGFISPETFQVDTDINGVNATMLFQEDSRKELLEKNGRREGPLFEGDESLLWAYKEFPNFSLEPLSLARVTNKNWFLKGKSSQMITLSSFAALQQAYLKNSQDLQKAYLNYSKNSAEIHKTILFPNKRKTEVFEDYALIILAMDGQHALSPHNRRYYFNSFSRIFEPIYYDGNLNLHFEINIDDEVLAHTFKDSYNSEYNKKFLEPKFIKDLLEGFKERVLINDSDAVLFFDTAITQIRKNLNNLYNRLNIITEAKDFKKSTTLNLESYLKLQNKLNLEQNIVTSLSKNNGMFQAEDQSGQIHFLSEEIVAKMLSDNEIKGERYVYLPSIAPVEMSAVINVNAPKYVEGELLSSQGVSINIDEKNKTIKITQGTSKGWVLFKDSKLTKWTIIFEGKKNVLSSSNDQVQRFNNYGLTGCLNFYETSFEDTNILIRDGDCEDSLNIIKSNGYIDQIQVESAFADAIDIDFSNIKIRSVKVDKAGNDCFDVSGGKYFLNDMTLFNCADKGISVGEKSNLTADNVRVEVASIGVSSKDLSDTFILNANFLNTKNCYEAAQKKQEFGGARLEFTSLSCKGRIIKDKFSTVIVRAK